MFDVGFWEVSLIAIVALVVVGPERLPGMTRTAGQLLGRARQTMRELKYDLERDIEFDEVAKIKKDFSKKSISDLGKSLDEAVDLNERIEVDDSKGS